jgi:phosphoribosylformylglycinamidine synthase
VTLAFKHDGEAILLVGETTGWLGQSVYLRDVCGQEAGAPPPVDLIEERENGDFVRSLILDGTATAVHDLSDGGLAVAVAEMAMAGRRGASLEPAPDDVPAHAFWFGEDQARYLVTVPQAKLAEVTERAKRASVLISRLGTTGGDALTLGSERPILVKILSERFESWLPAYMAGETV